MNRKVVSLVMAGGSGTRFWPLSRKHYPKQFLKLFSDKSLLEETLYRIQPMVTEGHFICCSDSQKKIIQQEVKTPQSVIEEPFGKNTTACLMLSLATLLNKGMSKDTVMMVVPADSFISDLGSYQKSVRQAISKAAEGDYLVTLGVTPDKPSTAYGYLKVGNSSEEARPVARFVEKPDLNAAVSFLKSGNYFWNSGTFFWKLSSLEKAFEDFVGSEWAAIKENFSSSRLTEIYENLHSVPIDISVMEKAKNVFMVPLTAGWSDVGSWNSLFELRKEKDSMVSLKGNVRSLKSENCLVYSDSAKVTLVGVKDLVIVESQGELLVLNRQEDQLVKEVAEK